MYWFDIFFVIYLDNSRKRQFGIMILKNFFGVLFFLTANGKYLLVDIKEQENAMDNTSNINIGPRSLAVKSTYRYSSFT